MSFDTLSKAVSVLWFLEWFMKVIVRYVLINLLYSSFLNGLPKEGMVQHWSVVLEIFLSNDGFLRSGFTMASFRAVGIFFSLPGIY